MQTDRPRISVIVPSYNQGHFLRRTLDSILQQGWPELELIVIDGGSTDDSVDIIREYESHIHHWVSEPDGGLSHALNKGLAVATGELIGWQNSDDYYLPGAFHALAAAWRPDVDVVFGDLLLVDAKEQTIRDLRYCPFTADDVLYYGMTMANQSALFKRRTLVDIGGLREDLLTAMDGELFLRLRMRSDRFVHVPRHLGAFRIYPGTITSENKRSERSLREWSDIRRPFGVEMEPELRWGKQFRLRKLAYLLRKAVYLARSGDAMYLLRGAATLSGLRN